MARFNRPGLERRALNQQISGGTVTDPAQLARKQRRLAFVSRKMGRPVPKQRPAAPANNIPPPNDQVTATQPMQQPQAPQGNGNANALFPDERMFEFENYSGSPMYKFQQEQGLKALDKRLAATGQLGSGFQFENYNKFLNELGANEAERNSQITMRAADRLERMQENESQRRERAGNENWNRNYQLLSLMAAQNPMSYAFQGTQNLGDAYGGLGNRADSFYSDFYPRASGGGGYIAPPYLPPAASGPDFSQYNVRDSASDAASNNDWLSSIFKIGASFFG